MHLHTPIVSGIAGLLVRHLQAARQTVAKFAKQNDLCEQTVRNFLSRREYNPTIRTCTKILRGIRKLEDVFHMQELGRYRGAAAEVIRLHERRKRRRNAA